MRKLIFLEHITLDGFVAGPDGEMDWIIYNDELEKYSHDLTATADATLYGRVTYQMMESYWPSVSEDPTSTKPELEYAQWLNNATKFVVSKSLEKVEWQNSLIIRENLAEEITRLKQQPGQNVLMFGSATLAQTLMKLGLIDEYRLNINPVVLGRGQPLFGNLTDKLELKLLEVNHFKGGVVALRYEPVRP